MQRIYQVTPILKHYRNNIIICIRNCIHKINTTVAKSNTQSLLDVTTCDVNLSTAMRFEMQQIMTTLNK